MQDCEWIEEVSAEFCCDTNQSVSCAQQREWFIEDTLEEQEKQSSLEEAQELNEKAGTVIQWVVIIVCAVCCPICIIIAVCNCVLKRKEARLQAMNKKSKTG